MKTPCLKWEVMHGYEDENGNPTQWVAEISHPRYGKYCWIFKAGKYYSVEVYRGGFIDLVKCRSLVGAKLWAFLLLVRREYTNA